MPQKTRRTWFAAGILAVWVGLLIALLPLFALVVGFED